MEARKLEKKYPVHVYETGPDGRITLWSLFNYMQDIASEHAVMLGFGRDDLMIRNHFWVLSRMYAEIYDLPSWNEELLVSTWPYGTDKMFALRYYNIRHADGREIAAASSSWLIIDRTTKKIQRPGELFSGYNTTIQSLTPTVRLAEKITGVTDAMKTSPPSRVKISDLDVNMHTNNVNYLRWVCETYNPDFIISHSPCSAEINYLAESLYDEEIVILTSSEKGEKTYFNHSVVRKDDNRELCRIKLEWKR